MENTKNVQFEEVNNKVLKNIFQKSRYTDK